MTVKPGYGFDSLHLRQSSSDLREIFGAPKSRRKSGTFREYWLYPSAHFDCIVSKRTGSVLSIFLRIGNPLVDPDMFGVTEATIRRIYGRPTLEGGGFASVTGGYVGRWLSFDTGLGFQFDRKGHVEMVSVFAPKRKKIRKAKASASHHVSEHAIAALRSL